MASLFDAAATGPGDDGDVGVRWSQAYTEFATTPNATRAHLVANNMMAGGVTPATFDDQDGTAKRIDWLVLHHGRDVVILNIDSSLTGAGTQSYQVAIRENGGTGLWNFAVSTDENDADPYEMPTTQAILDAIVAVISTDSGQLDVIIYDLDVADDLAGWDAAALTYVVSEELALEAETGDPEAAFDLRAINAVPEALALEADTGNPEAAFDLRTIERQALALEAETGNPEAAFDLTAVAQNVQELALEVETGNPEAAFDLRAIERQQLALEADTGDPEAAFDLRTIERQALALDAATGNPEAAFDLRFIPQDVQQLALAAETGNPVASFDLRFIPQDVQRLALDAATGNPEAAFALTFVPQNVQLLMLEAETGAPIAVFDLSLADAIDLVVSELVSVPGGTYEAAVPAGTYSASV